PSDIRYEFLELGGFLSEEVTRRDWAQLIHATAAHLSAGGASGIVITTGTDTLAYTAGLLHWFFGKTRVPVILAASPSTAESQEAAATFKAAIQAAVSHDPGLWVLCGDQRLPAANLKFERVPGSSDQPAFRTWNRDQALASSPTSLGDPELSLDELTSRMEAAVRSVFVAKVFPGMQANALIALIDAGVRFFILELYDTGTANLRETPFSLRHALEYGQQKDTTFFCTSQQEGNVDFSRYVTSHDLWREGAIPMGHLTTESVYSRLLSVLVGADNWDTREIVAKMEQSE
ncbi:MAG: glutamyl-tRNA amidotransferase, partial [Spirochaetales bacterium]